MSASPQASAPVPSCTDRFGTDRTGRPERGVHAAVLVYPAPESSGGESESERDYAQAAGRQARALQRALPRGWRVMACIAGGEGCVAPAEAVRSARELGARRVVVVAMDPWRSAMSLAADDATGTQGAEAEIRECWGDEASLIDLHARCVRATAGMHGLSPGNSVLVLRLRGGCEAREMVDRAASLIASRLGWPGSRLRVECLGEGSAAGEVELENGGEGSAVLVHELDLRLLSCSGQRLPESKERRDGVGRIYRSSMHCPQKILSVLSALVRRGRHPMADAPPALYSWAGLSGGRELSKRLVMVGISVRGALGRGEGPVIRYCSPEDFRALKRPHGEVLSMLAGLRSNSHAFSEALVWNTCNRLELYGWLDESVPEASVQGVLADAARALFGEAALMATVLPGREALQHLLRTAAGLNSTLAGDAEILDQLESAGRMAEHAGTAGVHTAALLSEAAEVVRELRRQTMWGRFAHRYCEIALGCVSRDIQEAVKGRCVVVGGSTTAASVLDFLSHQPDSMRENLSLVYRGQRSGTLTRRLQAAIGPGRLVNVESYADSAVMNEIMKADVVFFAGDHREPVLNSEQLADRRDLKARPLTIVDFNTLGSTQGVEQTAGVRLIPAARLDLEIEAFNRKVMVHRNFRMALAEAEHTIAGHAGLARAGVLELSTGEESVVALDARRREHSWRLQNGGQPKWVSHLRGEVAV